MIGRRVFIIIVVYLTLITTSGESSADTEPADLTISWENLTPAIKFGKLGFYPAGSFLRSELYLLRFKVSDVSISLDESAKVLSKPRGFVKEIVLKKDAIAGINANFFDTLGQPLGLVLPASRDVNKRVQLGGKLLTAVFYISNDLPFIVQREEFKADGIQLALQAGPLLFSSGLKSEFKSPSQTSRRSGIAITKSGELVLFATLLRFPGSTLEDMQTVLFKTGLEVRDAINLDGGGSSQLFIKGMNQKEEISISGGDEVPVALVVGEK